ncbi:GmrSD restriction endonuclease domain-containing protein [Nocardiopsis dassonvillei]|uniref:GmrSD restriction endonuclease domain-containing protein n=1 Tax=Nocardiopsis dassonvillei TaxID=2014 RepID=UPI00362AE2B9
MAVDTFDSTKEFLEELLKKVADGRIQLPDFQRGWVWSHSGISSLVASISQGYPVGTLMFLQTGGKSRFKQRAVEGVSLSGPREAETLILDGQQRMTSLYQAVSLKTPVQTHDERGKKATGWFYLDIEAAVDPGVDREQAVRFLPEDRIVRNFRKEVTLDCSSPEKEYEAKLFPLNQILDSSDWAEEFREHYDYAKPVRDLWKRFDTEVVKRFEKYQLPLIELGKETPREAVCQVFEKVNTGGEALTVFELLTATFAADEFELRPDWEERRNTWLKDSRYRVLEQVKDTDFLQTVTLLATQERNHVWRKGGGDPDRAPRVGCRRAEMLRLSLEDYRGWADRTVDAMLRTARFLYGQCVYDTKFLPYGTQIIPLAAIFATLGEEAETPSAQEKISRWFWCGILGEMYGGSTESRFARDLPDVVSWVRDESSVPRTVEEAQFSAGRLETLRTRNSAAYKGIYALLLKRDISDWRTGTNIKEDTYFDHAVDIHHVFPQKWCEGRGVSRDWYDSIVNKTPLSATTNRSIGGHAPSSYLERLQGATKSSSEQMDSYLERHLIDPAHLRADDFEAFYEARSALLIDLVAEAMGKPVTPVEE